MSLPTIAAFAGMLAGGPHGGARVHWQAPPECPRAERGIAAVERLLAAPLATERPVPVTVEVTLEPDAEGWVLTFGVETRSGRRDRTLKGTDCAELAETAALLAAVAIEPDMALRPAPAPPPPPETIAPETTAPETTAPVPDDPVTSHAEHEDVRALRWHAGIHGGVDIATLGRVGAMVGGTTGLRWRALRVDIGVLHRFVHRVAVAGSDRGEARWWSTAGTLDACGAPHFRIVEFPLCGGVEVGALSGRSAKIRQPAFDRSLWLAFRARLGLVVWIHPRVGVTWTAMLLVPITRNRVRVDGPGPLFRVPPVAGSVNLGAEVRLW